MSYDSDRDSRGFPSAALVAALCCAVTLATCKPGSPDGPTGLGEETFSVTLEWTAPTVDAQGGPLEDLAGYRIHYRATTPANGAGATTSDVADVTRATVSGLPAGRWYFGVTARDAAGNESSLSNEILVEVGQ